MAHLTWTPWHKVVTLRDDLRSSELSLSIFAADLYGVAMQKGQRPVYEDPTQFFALTYLTYNLRELVKDVVLRLGGKIIDDDSSAAPPFFLGRHGQVLLECGIVLIACCLTITLAVVASGLSVEVW